MLRNKPVISPGAYFFIKIVATRCGKMALKIIDPKNPTKIHLPKLDCGK